MYRRSKFGRHLSDFIVWNRFDLEFGHALSSPIRLKNQIAIDNHTNWEARPNCECWLDVETASNHLPASLIQRVGGTTAQCSNDCTVVAICVGALAELGTDCQKRRQRGGFEEFTPVIVDLVLEACVTCGVRARLSLEDNRTSIRHDQPRPDEEHT